MALASVDKAVWLCRAAFLFLAGAVPPHRAQQKRFTHALLGTLVITRNSEFLVMYFSVLSFELLFSSTERKAGRFFGVAGTCFPTPLRIGGEYDFLFKQLPCTDVVYSGFLLQIQRTNVCVFDEILLAVSRGEFKAGMSGAAPSRSHPCIRHTCECCCYFCCPSSFRL